MAGRQPQFKGYLFKQSMWLRDWRRRYFELYKDQLTFSKTEHSESHGSIDLRDCLTVKSAEDKTNKKFAFEIATREQVFYMYADSEKEKDEWIGAIGRAIVRSSPAYVNDADEGDEDEDSD